MPTVRLPKRSDDLLIPDGSGKSWAGVGVDSDENVIKYNADGTMRRVKNTVDVTETLAADKTLVAADSGKTYFLGEADGFDVVLPAVAAGLNFTFMVSVAPSGTADYTITANASDEDSINGQVHAVPEDDAGVRATDENVITFVDGSALPGDWISLVSDGTGWFITGGSVNVLEAITFAQAA